jgi:hypothetical protein
MNAETRSPHLDLADLIAEAAGRAVDDRTREHLASCAHCRAEAGRWNLVAGGVRGLAADVPAALPAPALPGAPRPAWPRVLAGRRAPAGPHKPDGPRGSGVLGRRPVLAVSAAAAVVLIGGVVAALSGHAPGRAGTEGGPALISITGCPTLAQVNGTLEQRSGGDLVIQTASVTISVSTTAATRLAVSRAPLSDITDGAFVVVAGPSSGGTIAAARVAVGGKAALAGPPGTVVTQGTVADASPGGFTVITSTGARVPVTTSSATSVTVLPATLDQLQAGAAIIAVGHPGPGRTLSAVAVFQPPVSPSGAHASVTLGDCSPTSVDRAIMALASAG